MEKWSQTLYYWWSGRAFLGMWHLRNDVEDVKCSITKSVQSLIQIPDIEPLEFSAWLECLGYTFEVAYDVLLDIFMAWNVRLPHIFKNSFSKSFLSNHYVQG